MSKVNLTEFFTVQECSDSDVMIFPTFAEAEKQINKWNASLDEEFARWEKGESVPGLLISSELNGFGEMEYYVHPAIRPSGIYTHQVGWAKLNDWIGVKGFGRVKWGYLPKQVIGLGVFARPVKPQR